MARKSKADKAFDAAFDESFKRLANGVQFSVMDLAKMHDLVRDYVANGMPLDVAMAESVSKYRKN